MHLSTMSLLLGAGIVKLGGWDPGVRPGGGLPGISALKQLVGGGMTVVIILLVVALIASATAWAIGSITGRANMGSGGKTGVLVSLGAALVVGAASFLIRWFAQTGSAISASQLGDVIYTLAGAPLV